MTGGRFITFEGGEGVGKTTLISRLEKKLSDKGFRVVTAREPGSIPFGEMMRDWVLHRDPAISVGIKAEMLLFLAARIQHLEERILPELEKGTIVLCDRFNDSTIAYQGGARGLGMEWVKELCLSVCGGIEPDKTFLLDVEPHVGLERSIGDGDLIEDEAFHFHENVRQAYLDIAAANPERVVVIDAQKSPDEVFQSTWQELEKLL